MCTSGDDDAVVQQLENETFDKILAEGLKLKKKCKSLRVLLLETETLRMKDRNELEKQLVQQGQAHEQQLAQLSAQHHLERSQLSDHNDARLDEAHRNLEFCRREMERLQLELQEPLQQTQRRIGEWQDRRLTQEP